MSSMFLRNGTIICSLEPRRQDFSHQNKAKLTFPNHVINREQKWEECICGMIIHTYNLCPCFLGWGFKNPWNFMRDRQCLCYANEVTIAPRWRVVTIKTSSVIRGLELWTNSNSGHGRWAGN